MRSLRLGGASSDHTPDGPAPGDSAAEREFIAAAKAGDYHAFESLVQQYHERVFRLAHGMTKSQAEAEEAVQETFLVVFKNLNGFEGRSSFGSWLYRIAVNTVLMGLRRTRRRPLVSIEESSRQDDRDGDATSGQPSLAESIWPAGDWARQPDDKLLCRELGSRIEKAIDRLPEKYRLVLLLRDVDGQSNEQVAQTLGLTVPTVKARLHRSRLLVRKALERYFARR